ARSTTASFSASGSYVLRLTASDSALTATDDVAIVVNPAGSALPPPGLLAAYPFNEGSGSVTASTSGATATLNSATWTTGKFGNAVSFNGVSSYVEAPAVSAGTTATFEAWVYLNGSPTELVSVLNKWSQSVDDEYQVGINPSGTLLFSWQTTGGAFFGTPSYNDLGGVTAIPLNTLTHIAVVRDGVNVKFYINGVLDISVDALDTNPFLSGANTLRIGGQGRGGVNRYVNGKIDEVRIYNRALTQTEIQSDMATPIGGSTAPAPPPTNRAPVVNAGPDQTITLPSSANLSGTATDDALPIGSTLTTTWSKVSGPGTVTFGNVSARSTTASFSASGSYVLRLT